jgi:hypothetical protein
MKDILKGIFNFFFFVLALAFFCFSFYMLIDADIDGTNAKKMECEQKGGALLYVNRLSKYVCISSVIEIHD